MSKQKGLIKLVGTIGGVTFYNSDGEYLARMAGGPSKERIQNDPNFVRTRENNVEFGGAAKVGKAFRTALSGVLQTMAGRRLTGQLTKLFKSINLKGIGVRGKRPFTLTANKDMINGLDLKKLPIVKTEVGTIIGGKEFIIQSKKLFDRRRNKMSLEGRRIDDKQFEPVEKVFWEFEKKHNIKTDEIDTKSILGKRLRAELLCNLKDLAGLNYREILKINLFSDLKLNSLPSIYKNFKESRLHSKKMIFPYDRLKGR